MAAPTGLSDSHVRFHSMGPFRYVRLKLRWYLFSPTDAPNLRFSSRWKQAKLKPTTRVGCNFGSPNRIRTGVLALKGRCPRPLDDGAKTALFCSNAGKLYMDFDPLSRKYTLFYSDTESAAGASVPDSPGNSST